MHCRDEKRQPRRFCPFFCYSGFQFIKLITVFGRIDGFILRNSFHLSNLIKWMKELSSGEVQASWQLKVYCPWTKCVFDAQFDTKSRLQRQASLRRDLFHIAGQANRKNAILVNSINSCRTQTSHRLTYQVIKWLCTIFLKMLVHPLSIIFCTLYCEFLANMTLTRYILVDRYSLHLSKNFLNQFLTIVIDVALHIISVTNLIFSIIFTIIFFKAMKHDMFPLAPYWIHIERCRKKF